MKNLKPGQGGILAGASTIDKEETRVYQREAKLTRCPKYQTDLEITLVIAGKTDRESTRGTTWKIQVTILLAGILKQVFTIQNQAIYEDFIPIFYAFLF